MQMDIESYNSTWNLASNRLKPFEDTIQFFKDNHAELGLEKATSFLSIGPGNGQKDCAFLSIIPNIRTYIAVDTDAKFLDDVKVNVGKLKNVKVDAVHSSLVDFEGPSEPVDIVFLCHVLYFVYDTMSLQLQRVHQWLAPGGVAIVVVATGATHDHAVCEQDIKNALNLSGWNFDCSSVSVARTLAELGLKYTETKIPNPRSIHAGPGLEDLVEIMTGQKLTAQQVQIALKVMRKYCKTGSDVCMLENSVFVFKKQ